MRQAYAHIEEGTTYYQQIKEQVLSLAKNWNDTHVSKCNPQVIFDDCKRIFKYHKYISIDDIEPAFDLGLMGRFGENKGLNSETIFKWFTGLRNMKSQEGLKSHTAYQTEATFITTEQKKQTRLELIAIFMRFVNEYKERGGRVYPIGIDQYIPIFYRWFKKLGYIEIDEKKEQQILEMESKAQRDLRTLISRKPTEERETIKKIFYASFKTVIDNEFPIEEQLKSMQL